MTRGEEAERRVEERLREALSPAYHLYPNVAWTGPMRDRGPAEDGEADLVIAHPEHGILVLEVKAGEPSRDAQGRWWLGPIQLDRSTAATRDGVPSRAYRLVDAVGQRMPRAVGMVARPRGRRGSEDSRLRAREREKE
jgi:hypothetical protein